MVSLMPRSKQDANLRARQGIWRTCKQSTAMWAGEYEEHATLLCCLLTGVGFNAYVILGRGSRSPDVAYVLARGNSTSGTDGEETAPFNGEDVLFDPVEGLWWPIGDSSCELTEVGCAFNADDVYANVQPRVCPCVIVGFQEGDYPGAAAWALWVLRSHPRRLDFAQSEPHLMRFDFNREREWKRLSKRGVESGMTSLQEELPYSQPSEQTVRQLESAVEQQAMFAIGEARREKGMPTVPDMRLQQHLRNLIEGKAEGLESLERVVTFGNVSRGDVGFAHGRALGGAISGGSRTIVGVTLCMPYADIQQVREKVLGTSIHEMPFNDSARFAVACRAFPYPFPLGVSLWIYIACLRPSV